MSIIQALKNLIGYTSNDIDELFAVISIIIVIWFMFSLFNIVNAMFGKRY